MMCYRAVQLERELEGMRTRGVDLSAKQQEIEVARRAAKDADLHYHEAHKCVVITPVESSFLSKGFCGNVCHNGNTCMIIASSEAHMACLATLSHHVSPHNMLDYFTHQPCSWRINLLGE